MDKAELDSILKRCKQALQELYGDRFAGLVLYGSMARGDDDDESDVALLVLLRGEVNPYTEIRPIVHALYPIQLEINRIISVRALSQCEFESGDWSFVRNARADGVAV